MVKRTLNKTDLESYRNRLLQLRARLRGDVSAMEENTLRKSRSEASGDLSSMPLHMADIGTDNFEQEFTLSLMASEGEALKEIERALDRIDNGRFGLCESCEMMIPKTRLNAIPYTPLCVKCAAEAQHR